MERTLTLKNISGQNLNVVLNASSYRHPNIILNFLRKEKGVGNFINKEFEDNGWYIIDVSSLKDASTKLGKYLNNGKADNVYINAHGGNRKDYKLDKDGNKIPNLKTKRKDDFIMYDNSAIKAGESWLFASYFVDYIDPKKKETLTEQTLTDINSLIKIGNMVNKGKNLILGSCNTSLNDNFGKILVDLINQTIDLFINNNLTLSYNDGKEISFLNFTSYAQSDTKSTLGWDRFSKGKAKRVYKNLIINKFGVKVVTQ